MPIELQRAEQIRVVLLNLESIRVRLDNKAGMYASSGSASDEWLTSWFLTS